jgi:hypothetical protein
MTAAASSRATAPWQQLGRAVAVDELTLCWATPMTTRATRNSDR